MYILRKLQSTSEFYAIRSLIIKTKRLFELLSNFLSEFLDNASLKMPWKNLAV